MGRNKYKQWETHSDLEDRIEWFLNTTYIGVVTICFKYRWRNYVEKNPPGSLQTLHQHWVWSHIARFRHPVRSSCVHWSVRDSPGGAPGRQWWLVAAVRTVACRPRASRRTVRTHRHARRTRRRFMTGGSSRQTKNHMSMCVCKERRIIHRATQ